MKKGLVLLTICVLSLVSLFMLLQCNASSKTNTSSLSIKGSDTMVHLVSSWAETFMKNNPGADISVTGGGSGTGIAALLNGTTDIAAASRKIKEKELRLAAEKNIAVKEIIVARDGIAVIVNAQNPINELTIGQLENIFTGTVNNWNSVDGPDENIVVLSRESSSGTYVFFQKRVLNKKDYAAQARLMPATSSIVQEVSANPAAIGYVGLGYALEAGDDVKIIAVKNTAAAPAILPSAETVQSGKYSIARPLHLYVSGTMEGLRKKFVDFALSQDGQEIVAETGYVKVK